MKGVFVSLSSLMVDRANDVVIAIGIDPGVSGAVAMLAVAPGSGIVGHGEDKIASLLVYDLPTMQRGKTGNKQQINGRELARILLGYKAVRCHVYLELVKGMPRVGKNGSGMGATSAFNFGETFGCIRGVLETLDLAYTLVPPERWKKAAGLVGAEKDASRTRALQLFPDATAELARKKDVGRAEALLIAHFGSRLGL